MPQPQLAEKREAKRTRGWVFPEDPVGRKELGKRGLNDFAWNEEDEMKAKTKTGCKVSGQMMNDDEQKIDSFRIFRRHNMVASTVAGLGFLFRFRFLQRFSPWLDEGDSLRGTIIKSEPKMDVPHLSSQKVHVYDGIQLETYETIPRYERDRKRPILMT
ncbi:hypothetical protein G7054_g9427 [Neopestalotiopsis clavispora]|nr:hypothetical protein G7054_g9427 [Neopestalotiopsis clavispora]